MSLGCGAPPDIAHATADTSSAPGFVMYSCDHGYRLRGGTGLRCSGGAWGPVTYPFCESTSPLLSWWLALLLAILLIVVITVVWYFLCTRVCKCGDKTCPGSQYKASPALDKHGAIVTPAKYVNDFSDFDSILPLEFQYEQCRITAPALHYPAPDRYDPPVYSVEQAVELRGLASIPLSYDTVSRGGCFSDDDTPRYSHDQSQESHAVDVASSDMAAQAPPLPVSLPRAKTVA